ncbi:hypothetical protein TKK_0011537 [Trichogramma kaykai]|uniref:Uncharacterized protein n=1 Tax=Trichogramma kaykai TaxID=54128 RepID=A0ABD2WS16_9HYME
MSEQALTKQKRLAQNILNFYENSSSKAGRDNFSASHFQARLEILETYWSEFMDKHDDLLDLEREFTADDYFSRNGYEVVELEYTRAKALLRDHLAQYAPATPAVVPPAADRALPQAVSLLALSLPTFTGKQDEWESFKQRFSSLVVAKDSIPRVAKLQHLLNAVQGQAALRLKGMEITDANFEVAWQKLLRRYDNVRIRLANTLENLIQLPSVKKCGRAQRSDRSL